MEDTDVGNAQVRIEARFMRSSRSPGRLAYGLSVSVESAEGIPREVFLYRREGPVLSSDRSVDRESRWFFQNVCSPVDILETPADSEATEESRFARFPSCELVFRSQDDMERAAGEISSDLASLARTWENVTDGSRYESEETKVYTNER